MEKSVVFKDEFEKLGYSFEVNETDRGIEVRMQPGDLKMKLQVVNGVLDVIIRQPSANVEEEILEYFDELFAEMNEGYELVKTDEEKEGIAIPEKALEMVIKWLEEMALYKKCGYVAIKGKTVEKFLKEKGYTKIKDMSQYPYEFILNEYESPYYTKTIEPIKAELIEKLGRTIYEFLQNYQQKNCTMEYFFQKTNKIPIYVDGYEGMIEIDYQQTFSLKEENIKQTFPFNSVYELHEACQLLFKKIEEKQRIKNLLEAPRYHFDHYFTTFKPEAKNEVYTLLEKVMTKREIEEKCVNKRKEHTKVPIERIEHFRVFKFDNHYFIIEEQYGIEKLHIKTSMEETETFIFEEITKNKKKAIKNALLLL